MRLFELKQEAAAALGKAEQLLESVTSRGADFTSAEQSVFDAHMAESKRLQALIKPIEERSTLRTMVSTHGVQALTGGVPDASGDSKGGRFGARPTLDPQAGLSQAEQATRNFGAWVNNALTDMSGGVSPTMEATAVGPISIGSGTGLDSVGFAVGTSILPYLASYYALDSSCQRCGVFQTAHRKPTLLQPRPAPSGRALLPTIRSAQCCHLERFSTRRSVLSPSWAIPVLSTLNSSI